ncbi:MAG: hypothetical protein JO055_10915 [Alphaproteobacteria bacterium]|nr:hypothetical protein [Alphaproteobacteria bacterium]
MGLTPLRVLAIIWVTLASALLSLPAGAQQAGTVNCGNGNYCPAGHACLLGGQCGREIEHPPGATRMSTGNWCDPGFHEGTVNRGRCVPDGYTECGVGACRPGTTCSADGQCIGGPPATGPMCGGVQCTADRACSSNNRCYDPARYNDCGNGSICTKSAACEQPQGCVYVAPERIRQTPIR